MGPAQTVTQWNMEPPPPTPSVNSQGLDMVTLTKVFSFNSVMPIHYCRVQPSAQGTAQTPQHTAFLINTEAGGRNWHDWTEGGWALGVVFGHLKSFQSELDRNFP